MIEEPKSHSLVTELGAVLDNLSRLSRTAPNLFHGGKFTDGPMGTPGRDIELIRYALVILKACLDALPEMKKVYDEGKLYYGPIV